MKNKSRYLILLVILPALFHAQSRVFDLSLANSQYFHGNMHAFGITKQGGFRVYKLNGDLTIKDSLDAGEGRINPENYLTAYSDTLHDFLNIYLHGKERKGVTVIRLNRKFEVVAKLENVEIARLNNTSMFGAEVLYFKNAVYSVKTEKDTSGIQFYLNKYLLKSETANFDYAFKWQFPFERKNIHSAHIFYADAKSVFLFIHVSSGIKEGQWVLKIDSEQGKLLKATKLNEKTDSQVYLFGNYLVDHNSKSIWLIGQKFPDNQLQLDEGKLHFTSPPAVTLYALSIDSLGETSTKQSFKVPVVDIKTVKNGIKPGGGYLLRFAAPIKRPDGSIRFVADIFKTSGVKTCYLYSSTNAFQLTSSEDQLLLEKTSIQPNLQIEDYYITADKLDMNGKLCLDSLNQFERFFYKPLTFSVKQRFKLNADNNPVWLLSKHTLKKNGVNYSLLKPEAKIYKLSPVEEIDESKNPSLITLSDNSFIISSQQEEGKYLLKLYNW